MSMSSLLSLARASVPLEFGSMTGLESQSSAVAYAPVATSAPPLWIRMLAADVDGNEPESNWTKPAAIVVPPAQLLPVLENSSVPAPIMITLPVPLIAHAEGRVARVVEFDRTVVGNVRAGQAAVADDQRAA